MKSIEKKVLTVGHHRGASRNHLAYKEFWKGWLSKNRSGSLEDLYSSENPDSRMEP
jgi:hypothetical protein